MSRPRRHVHYEFSLGDRGMGFPQPWCAVAYTPQAVSASPDKVTCGHCRKIVDELRRAQ